jgi:hypothetical protein
MLKSDELLMDWSVSVTGSEAEPSPLFLADSRILLCIRKQTELFRVDTWFLLRKNSPWSSQSKAVLLKQCAENNARKYFSSWKFDFFM